MTMDHHVRVPGQRADGADRLFGVRSIKMVPQGSLTWHRSLKPEAWQAQWQASKQQWQTSTLDLIFHSSSIDYDNIWRLSGRQSDFQDSQSRGARSTCPARRTTRRIYAASGLFILPKVSFSIRHVLVLNQNPFSLLTLQRLLPIWCCHRKRLYHLVF